MLATLPFGTTTDGAAAHLFLLSNAQGMSVALTEVGASVVGVRVPDRTGNLLDVALGHPGVRGYEQGGGLMGATVGRVANRTAGARFELDGQAYQLAANEGPNNNHGGPDLWSTRFWQLAEADGDHVSFALLSPAGDQGFPGEVEMRVSYELTEDMRLVVRHEGTPSARTPMNLTNHSYWNLDGQAEGNVMNQTLSVDASSYLATDEANIPQGDPTPVEGTPFDLRKPRALLNALGELPHGFDHNFCLDAREGLAHAARLESRRTGIALDLFTDAPGLQVYMAGWLEGTPGKDGIVYENYAGVALEAQRWPDSLHHSNWPSVIFGPERPFAQTTVFAFSLA